MIILYLVEQNVVVTYFCFVLHAIYKSLIKDFDDITKPFSFWSYKFHYKEDSSLPIVQSLICFQNLLLNLKAHFAANFINNLLKIHFEKISINFLWKLSCSILQLRYYATFKVREIELLFYKIDTFLQKTNTCIGWQAEQIYQEM